MTFEPNYITWLDLKSHTSSFAVMVYMEDTLILNHSAWMYPSKQSYNLLITMWAMCYYQVAPLGCAQHPACIIKTLSTAILGVLLLLLLWVSIKLQNVWHHIHPDDVLFNTGNFEWQQDTCVTVDTGCSNNLNGLLHSCPTAFLSVGQGSCWGWCSLSC